MAEVKRFFFGTQSKTEIETKTQSYEHTFGFETEQDQNGYFSTNYGDNPPGGERITSKTVDEYTVTPRTGNYMMSTIRPPDNEIAGISVTFGIPEGAKNAFLEFWVFVHDELNDEISTNGWYALYDRLRITMNFKTYWHFRWADQDDSRSELTDWDPENPPYVYAGAANWFDGYAIAWGKWVPLRIPLSPGQHTFEFEHFIDGSESDPNNIFGTRSMYLDDLKVVYETAAGEVITTPAVELISFDGSEGYSTERKLEGAIMPPVKHSEYSLPFHPGSVHEYTSVEARDLSLSLWIQAQPGETIRDKIRHLISTIANKERGALFAEYQDGTTRELGCRLSEVDQDENPDTQGIGRIFRTMLTFRAFDPFWYGVLEKLTTTVVDEGTSINNNGDFETWPILRIFGPITDPEIIMKNPEDPADLEAVRRVKLNYTVLAGRIVSIDTRPGYKTITLDDGTNLYSTLDGSLDQMFSIPPGEWLIDLDGSGNDENTLLEINWRRAYWGL